MKTRKLDTAYEVDHINRKHKNRKAPHTRHAGATTWKMGRQRRKRPAMGTKIKNHRKQQKGHNAQQKQSPRRIKEEKANLNQKRPTTIRRGAKNKPPRNKPPRDNPEAGSVGGPRRTKANIGTVTSRKTRIRRHGQQQ